MLKKVLLTATGMACAALLVASPAFSSAPAPLEPSFPGHDAQVNVPNRAYGYSFKSRTNQAYVVAWDDAQEQNYDPVYLMHWRKSDRNKKITLYNKNGGGTFTTSSKGAALVKMEICVAEGAKPDSCSGEYKF